MSQAATRRKWPRLWKYTSSHTSYIVSI